MAGPERAGDPTATVSAPSMTGASGTAVATGPIGSGGTSSPAGTMAPAPMPTAAGTMAPAPAPSTAGTMAPATAGTAGTTNPVDNDEGDGPPMITFACPGGTIGPGMNNLMVGALMRTLHAEFPANRSVPIGIVFSWHGFNEDPVAYRNHVGLAPDGDPALPLVVITPDDVDFEIPDGLDWQLNSGEPAENVDLAFFEAMVGCLNEQYEIDPTRIYSVGFSAGSVMSSLLHSRYPKLLSAIVCFSGMWFNDPAQVALINLVPVTGSWPMLDPADSGTVLLTHGGPGDVTVLNVANLEDMAQAAFPFLKTNNRIVVDCAHGQGHTPHPEFTHGMVAKFLSAHRAGEPSPYADGGLQGFPPSCTLRLP